MMDTYHVLSIVSTVMIAAMGVLGSVWGAKLRTKVMEVHVLVNSNLTAISEALARETQKVRELESDNAMLRGEPSSTPQVAASPTLPATG